MESYLVFQSYGSCTFDFDIDIKKFRKSENFYIQKIIKGKLKIQEIYIEEEEDYLLLKNYFIEALNGGYQNKVINNLIVDKFTKVSIKLAINLIKLKKLKEQKENI